MDPELYERLATVEELDRQPSESDRAIADRIEYGAYGEDGGEVGSAEL